MGEKMKRLCTILARGGSKGVPNKNIRLLGGKPLIAQTIGKAKESGLFDFVAVSSDSDEILSVARSFGAGLLVKRPAELAGDAAPKIPAIKHCVLEAEKMAGSQYDVICDLDPTSPFRSADDIRSCVALLESKKVQNIITGALARKSPYFNLVEIDPKGIARLSKPLDKKIVRRQDAPKCFDMNASIYVWQRNALMNSESVFLADTLLYEMPRERSIDIDDEFDFEVAHYLASKGLL